MRNNVKAVVVNWGAQTNGTLWYTCLRTVVSERDELGKKGKLDKASLSRQQYNKFHESSTNRTGQKSRS